MVTKYFFTNIFWYWSEHLCFLLDLDPVIFRKFRELFMKRRMPYNQWQMWTWIAFYKFRSAFLPVKWTRMNVGTKDLSPTYVCTESFQVFASAPFNAFHRRASPMFLSFLSIGRHVCISLSSTKHKSKILLLQ